MNAKSNLGRGLSALLGDEISIINDENSLTDNKNTISRGYQKLAIAALVTNKKQPRTHFDDEALQELATSLKNTGMLQPILVRPVKNDNETFEIVAGERRWRAAQKAGLHEVPVIIRELNDQEANEIALIENIQREDLNALEEARGYLSLQEKYNYTQEMLSERIGKSRSAIANSLRLLKLPSKIAKMIEEDTLTAGHARMLLSLEEDKALELANQIIQKNLSVRDVESMISKNKKPVQGIQKTAKNPNIEAQEKLLSDHLGLIAEIIPKRTKGGKIVITFSDDGQYRELFEKLIKQ